MGETFKIFLQLLFLLQHSKESCSIEDKSHPCLDGMIPFTKNSILNDFEINSVKPCQIPFIENRYKIETLKNGAVKGYIDLVLNDVRIRYFLDLVGTRKKSKHYEIFATPDKGASNARGSYLTLDGSGSVGMFFASDGTYSKAGILYNNFFYQYSDFNLLKTSYVSKSKLKEIKAIGENKFTGCLYIPSIESYIAITWVGSYDNNGIYRKDFQSTDKDLGFVGIFISINDSDDDDKLVSFFITKEAIPLRPNLFNLSFLTSGLLTGYIDVSLIEGLIRFTPKLSDQEKISNLIKFFALPSQGDYNAQGAYITATSGTSIGTFCVTGNNQTKVGLLYKNYFLPYHYFDASKTSYIPNSRIEDIKDIGKDQYTGKLYLNSNISFFSITWFGSEDEEGIYNKEFTCIEKSLGCTGIFVGARDSGNVLNVSVIIDRIQIPFNENQYNLSLLTDRLVMGYIDVAFKNINKRFTAILSGQVKNCNIIEFTTEDDIGVSNAMGSFITSKRYKSIGMFIASEGDESKACVLYKNSVIPFSLYDANKTIYISRSYIRDIKSIGDDQFTGKLYIPTLNTTILISWAGSSDANSLFFKRFKSIEKDIGRSGVFVGAKDILNGLNVSVLINQDEITFVQNHFGLVNLTDRIIDSFIDVIVNGINVRYTTTIFDQEKILNTTKFSAIPSIGLSKLQGCYITSRKNKSIGMFYINDDDDSKAGILYNNQLIPFSGFDSSKTIFVVQSYIKDIHYFSDDIFIGNLYIPSSNSFILISWIGSKDADDIYFKEFKSVGKEVGFNGLFVGAKDTFENLNVSVLINYNDVVFVENKYALSLLTSEIVYGYVDISFKNANARYTVSLSEQEKTSNVIEFHAKTENGTEAIGSYILATNGESIGLFITREGSNIRTGILYDNTFISYDSFYEFKSIYIPRTHLKDVNNIEGNNFTGKLYLPAFKSYILISWVGYAQDNIYLYEFKSIEKDIRFTGLIVGAKDIRNNLNLSAFITYTEIPFIANQYSLSPIMSSKIDGFIDIEVDGIETRYNTRLSHQDKISNVFEFTGIPNQSFPTSQGSLIGSIQGKNIGMFYVRGNNSSKIGVLFNNQFILFNEFDERKTSFVRRSQILQIQDLGDDIFTGKLYIPSLDYSISISWTGSHDSNGLYYKIFKSIEKDISFTGVFVGAIDLNGELKVSVVFNFAEIPFLSDKYSLIPLTSSIIDGYIDTVFNNANIRYSTRVNEQESSPSRIVFAAKPSEGDSVAEGSLIKSDNGSSIGMFFISLGSTKKVGILKNNNFEKTDKFSISNLQFGLRSEITNISIFSGTTYTGTLKTGTQMTIRWEGTADENGIFIKDFTGFNPNCEGLFVGVLVQNVMTVSYIIKKWLV